MKNFESQQSPYVFFGSTVAQRSQTLDRIYQDLLQEHAESDIFFCDARSLFYDFLEALRSVKLPQWRESLLNKKYILIDGFHYFEEKKSILDDLTYFLKHTKAIVILTLNKPVSLCDLGEDMLYILSKGTHGEIENMKFCEFINSRDIRQHWEKIKYIPTALESAWLVWQSKNHTLEEKHAAWKNIIESYKDCAIPAGIHDLPQPSLHHFLKRYMEIETHLVSLFYKEESNAVYSYRQYFDDNRCGDWCEENAIFRTFDEAYAHAKGDGEPPHPNFVEFAKTYIGKDGKHIFVRFNLEREIVRVDECNYLCDEQDYEIFQEVFRNMWFSFPTPFKKGDIVKTVLGKYTRPTTFADLFVLTSVCTEVERSMTDGSDMTAYGYFIDRDGVAYHECIHNYMDLEYVKTPLADENKLLLPISKYLRGEIDLGLLLGAYRNILCKNEANEVYLSLNYTKEGKELAGMEK